MRQFFRPWRRKIGVVTLLMACVFTVGWVRSLTTIDAIIFPARLHTTDALTSISIDTLMSRANAIYWGREYLPTTKEETNDWVGLQSQFPTWETYSADPRINDNQLPFDTSLLKWRWRCSGFGVYISDDQPTEGLVLIPYWSIVIPLTALSAFLLLSKPKPSTQKRISEPTANEGT